MNEKLKQKLEEMELSKEELHMIAAGDLHGGDLDEGDLLYLETFMMIYKARGTTMDGFIAQMVGLGCGDAAVSYIMSRWDSI